MRIADLLMTLNEEQKGIIRLVIPASLAVWSHCKNFSCDTAEDTWCPPATLKSTAFKLSAATSGPLLTINLQTLWEVHAIQLICFELHLLQVSWRLAFVEKALIYNCSFISWIFFLSPRCRISWAWFLPILYSSLGLLYSPYAPVALHIDQLFPGNNCNFLFASAVFCSLKWLVFSVHNTRNNSTNTMLSAVRLWYPRHD